MKVRIIVHYMHSPMYLPDVTPEQSLAFEVLTHALLTSPGHL